jgi:hypothetical protein
LTFVFTASGSTSQNVTVTYSSPIINTNLKVPVLGITDLGYQIVSRAAQVQLKVEQYFTTFMKFSVSCNLNSYLSTLKLTYMAIDNSFTPAFSMNYYFPVRFSPLSASTETVQTGLPST